MSETLLISVVVPIYNTGMYLDTCIQSIRSQRYKNLEIILVDDGSTDHSPKLCDSYGEKDNRIKVIHKKNGGLVSARKAGVDMACGDYITFVDGDDWIKEDLYESLAEPLKRYMPDVLAFGFKQQNGRNEIGISNALPSGVYEADDIKEKIIPKLLVYKDGEGGGIFAA